MTCKFKSYRVCMKLAILMLYQSSCDFSFYTADVLSKLTHFLLGTLSWIIQQFQEQDCTNHIKFTRTFVYKQGLSCTNMMHIMHFSFKTSLELVVCRDILGQRFIQYHVFSKMKTLTTERTHTHTHTLRVHRMCFCACKPRKYFI